MITGAVQRGISSASHMGSSVAADNHQTAEMASAMGTQPRPSRVRAAQTSRNIKFDKRTRMF